MKVILQKDHKNLGKAGDIIEVAEGYGRNYLLPRGLATEATEGNIRTVKIEKQVQKKKKARELEEAQIIADRVNGQKLQISTKVGEGGKLFGSITSQEIAQRLKVQYKVDLDKRKINLAEPIKSIGKYTVAIRIHPEIKAEITVDVVEKK